MQKILANNWDPEPAHSRNNAVPASCDHLDFNMRLYNTHASWHISPKQFLQGAILWRLGSGKKAAALTLKSAVLSALWRADEAHSFVGIFALLGQPAKLGLKGSRVLGRNFCAARVEEGSERVNRVCRLRHRSVNLLADPFGSGRPKHFILVM